MINENLLGQARDFDMSRWDWPSIVSIALAAMGIVLLQVGMIKSARQVWLGSLLLLGAGFLSFLRAPFDLDHYLFLAFAALAAGGGVGLLVFRDPVHAALGFATTILSTCGLFFLQSASFLGAATLIVYAGATIIVFLFVLMYAQQSDLTYYDVRLTAPLLSVLLACAFTAVLVHVIQTPTKPRKDRPQYRAASAAAEGEFPSKVAGLGRSLFSDYLFAVELAGALLTIAAIGAIAASSQSPLPSHSPDDSKETR